MMEKLSDNSETSFEEIKTNLQRIRENIEKTGRADKVRIMAVTKTVSTEKVNFAIDQGIDLLGENRVQEYLEKRELYKPAEVHFIGSLQTNKVKYIIDKVSMIHSVDSLRLAEEIDRRAGQHGIVMDILTEINIGGEHSKGGISVEEAEIFRKKLGDFKNLRLRGLMTIPPPECGEDVFERMHQLFGEWKTAELKAGNDTFDTLSMGMSADYKTAVKHGATIIRIGSGLFGYRKNNTM